MIPDQTRQLFNEEKKKIFESYLSQQQMAREKKIEKKKKQDEEKKNPEEHMLYIQKQFKAKAEVVQEMIKKYKAKEETFDNLFKEYSGLKQYYVNVSYALKTYDRQSYKQNLDKLYNTIMDLKRKHEPRKKFKFKRRDQDFGVQGSQQEVDVHVLKESKEHFIPGIKEKSGETLTIREGWSNLGSYKIIECDNCTVELLDKTEILFLKKLTNCKIKAALTKSTVFVDECKDCLFEINCHQLRIHNTFDTRFNIFVTSKAIIEDCDRVIFSPYTFLYENRESDMKQFERSQKPNLWRQIQDFNWLKENQKSPHYQLIDE